MTAAAALVVPAPALAPQLDENLPEQRLVLPHGGVFRALIAFPISRKFGPDLHTIQINIPENNAMKLNTTSLTGLGILWLGSLAAVWHFGKQQGASSENTNPAPAGSTLTAAGH